MKNYNYSESDIQKYILNELSNEEVIKFEQAMKENLEFALEVESHIKMAKGIEFHGASELKSRLKDLYSEVRPEILSKTRQKSSRFSSKNVGIATIILVLIVFCLYRFISVKEPLNSEAIYATHYQKYDWNPNVRSDEAQSLDFNKAIQLYDSNNFNQAMNSIQQYLKKNPQNIPARLALANCHLKNDKPSQAIIHLQFLLKQDDILYRDETNWYLGLAYLKNNEIEKAEQIFSELIEIESVDFSDQAKKIINKMN